MDRRVDATPFLILGFIIATVVLQPSQARSVCLDHRRECAGWAALGECQKNPVYMLLKCPVSCGSCGGVIFTYCTDTEVKCPGWAHLGECLKNPVYMKATCKKSCGVC